MDRITEVALQNAADVSGILLPKRSVEPHGLGILVNDLLWRVRGSKRRGRITGEADEQEHERNRNQEGHRRSAQLEQYVGRHAAAVPIGENLGTASSSCLV